MNVTVTDVLGSLFNPTDTVCFRVFDDKKGGVFQGSKLSCECGKYKSIEETLKNHNAMNRGIFFVVNYGGQDDDSITRINAQFVEMDNDSFDEQQKKIEQIIGVKADLIAALKKQFDEHNLNVVIDEATGSIALDSNVLFSYNESELTDEGIQMLGEVLPLYCKVLMEPQYQDYLAELSIDGYTDTSGDYLYNLQLSQARALAVTDYLFANADSYLTADELSSLKEKLTSNGHSMSNPVYTDGEVDMDASRRVEVRFRLKDEEMINELKDILDESSLAATETKSETNAAQ